LAEDRGVEGTLKQGRGPVYRQRMTELETLQDQSKIKTERTKDAQKRLATVETRIAQIERELSTVDGDLAKLKGEADTAEQRIKSTLAANTEEEGTKLDPARVLPAFERARAAFRQQPDTERLASLQQQCGNLLNAMSSTQATKEKVRAIDCDPKQAAEAAARVFALNSGLVAFHNTCAGGENSPATRPPTPCSASAASACGTPASSAPTRPTSAPGCPAST
jgi:DNA repair exonuclease SbcCD ATPase subunit